MLFFCKERVKDGKRRHWEAHDWDKVLPFQDHFSLITPHKSDTSIWDRHPFDIQGVFLLVPPFGRVLSMELNMLSGNHQHFLFKLDFHRQVDKAFTPVLDFSNFLQGLALSAVFYLNNSFYLKLLAFWKKNTLLKRYQISGMPERAKQKWSIFRFRVETPAAMPAISWLKF